MLAFAVQKLFSLIQSYLFISTFVALAFSVRLKKSLLRPMQGSLSHMFSSRNFMVSGLTLKSLIHFEWIVCYVWSKVVGSGSFFCLGLFSFPNKIYWKDYLLPTVYSWLLFHKLIDHTCVGLFLRFLFYSIDLYIGFNANTILFWLL